MLIKVEKECKYWYFIMRTMTPIHDYFLGSFRVVVPVDEGAAGPLLVVPGEEDEENGLGRKTTEHRDMSSSGV